MTQQRKWNGVLSYHGDDRGGASQQTLVSTAMDPHQQREGCPCPSAPSSESRPDACSDGTILMIALLHHHQYFQLCRYVNGGGVGNLFQDVVSSATFVFHVLGIDNINSSSISARFIIR